MKEGREQKGKVAYGGTFPTKTSERGDTEVLGERKVVVITTADHSSGTYPNNDVRSNIEELMGGGTRRLARHKKNNLQSLKRHIMDAYQDTNSSAFSKSANMVWCMPYWPTDFQNCTSLTTS